MERHAQKCAELIHNAKTVAALTGAGISTSAGIPDFRGPRGLYVTKKYDADKVFDINHFLLDPEPFFEFARDFVGLEQTLQPTPTHKFLSQLEKTGKLEGIITQNIDCLHQSAGSQNVLELHGSFVNSYCMDCERHYEYDQMKQKLVLENIPFCECGGVVKPDIVFFGENVRCLDEAYALVENVDLLFVIGTSCAVYPAAMIPTLANGQIVVVNLSPIQNDYANIVLSVEADIDEFFLKVSQFL